MVGPDSNDGGLPAGWTEADDMEALPETDDARPVALYEREGADVAVQVYPAEPNVVHADTNRWRVAVVRDTAEGSGRTDPLTDVDGREDALEAARSFMRAYEDAEGVDERDRVDRAMEAVPR